MDAGTSLAVQGDNAYELFFIEAGEAEVRRDGEVLATLSPGDVFGEIGVLVTGTRTASVVAISPMRLLALFTRDFTRIKAQMPALVRARSPRRWPTAWRARRSDPHAMPEPGVGWREPCPAAATAPLRHHRRCLRSGGSSRIRPTARCRRSCSS